MYKTNVLPKLSRYCQPALKLLSETKINYGWSSKIHIIFYAAVYLRNLENDKKRLRETGLKQCTRVAGNCREQIRRDFYRSKTSLI